MSESESGVDSMSWSGSWEFGSLWAKSWIKFWAVSVSWGEDT